MPNLTEEQIAQLLQMADEFADLKKQVDDLTEHQHLGNDGSKEFQGQTDFVGRSLVLGGGVVQGDKVFVPFQMVDSQLNNALISDKSSRVAAIGVLVTNKYAANEQIHAIFSTIKNLPIEDINTPLNRLDWAKLSEGRVRVISSPQGQAAFSGPSVFGPLAFIVGERTPSVQSTGTISLNGSVLTDSTAKFPVNSLIGSLINISTLEGNYLCGYKVLANTENTITLGHYKANGAAEIASFPHASGQYAYYMIVPALLGAAQNPYDRGYFGQDIRMGYGPSEGSDVRYIKWGNGSPEGVVPANIGSMYLRFDGATSTTLYIKTANNIDPVNDPNNIVARTGWTAK